MQRVRVERIWTARRNLLDEALGLGLDGDLVLAARCHPLNGGKPIVMPVSMLEEKYELEPVSDLEEKGERDGR